VCGVASHERNINGAKESMGVALRTEV